MFPFMSVPVGFKAAPLPSLVHKKVRRCGAKNPAKKAGNRFARGSGCYTCSSCGKKTRSTGRGDNENCGVCVKCFDNGGLENQHSDEGHAGDVASCPLCLAAGYQV